MRRSLPVFLFTMALALQAPACIHRSDGTADVSGSVQRAARNVCPIVGPGAAVGAAVAAAVSSESQSSNDSAGQWITRGAALAASLCGAILALLHAPKVESADASAGELPDASAAPAPAL